MPSGVTWYGQQTMTRINSIIAQRLVAAAVIVEGRMKTSMQTQKTGRWYRKPYSQAMYQASAPGESPAVRTARLLNSITHDVPRKTGNIWSIRAGTNVKDETTGFNYPYHLEFGFATRLGIVLPRPWGRPALDNSIREIRALFRMGRIT